MAIIICPECGKSVSNQAKTCPHCGFNIYTHIKHEKLLQKKKKLHNGLQTKSCKSIIIGIAAIVLVLGTVLGMQHMKYSNFSGEYRGNGLGVGSITFEEDKTGIMGFMGAIFEYKLSGDTLRIYNIYDPIGTTGYNPYDGQEIIGKVSGDTITFTGSESSCEYIKKQ